MLFGRGRAARVKIGDSHACGVAQPQTTQCSHSVSEQKRQVILVGSNADTLTRTETQYVHIYIMSLNALQLF